MLLGLTPVECNGTEPECDSTVNNLYVSQDNGYSWKLIIKNVEQALWDIKQSYPNAKPNRIIIAHYDLVESEKNERQAKKR